MDVLVIEDDSFKYFRIEGIVRSSMADARIFRADNVRDAVIYLNDHSPDKIILDMSLPSHSPKAGEGSPLAMPAGGMEVIMEMDYLHKNDIPIIILTQYADVQIENDYFSIEEAGAEIQDKYAISHLKVALYEDGSEDWQKTTKKFLEA